MPRWTLVQRLASSTHLFPEDPHRHLWCRGMTWEDEIKPHSWLFLLAARQSVQAPSALAPQRRLALPFVGKR